MQKDVYKSALTRSIEKLGNAIKSIKPSDCSWNGDDYLDAAFQLIKAGKHIQAAQLVMRSGVFDDYVRPTITEIRDNAHAACYMNGYAFFDALYKSGIEPELYLIARIAETMTKMARVPAMRSSTDDIHILIFIICLMSLEEMKNYAIQQKLDF